MSLDPRRVLCARSPRPAYEPCPGRRYPEVPEWVRVTTSLATLRALLVQAGLDEDRRGTPAWNPLGAFIREGDRVVLKPNWVRHRNGSSHGLDCLVTHADVLEAVLFYASIARPGRLVVGDAPVQGCDLSGLLERCGVPGMVERFRAQGLVVDVRDFRRTILAGERLGSTGEASLRGLDEYVLVDLGMESELEPISLEGVEFRVTMYDPAMLARTHAKGRHQYLVAREVLDADVVINLPKLKTHKKAGLTGALKNMVGMNGHKEYLPHHRKGGSAAGGDCYPGRSFFKRRIEDLLDATNHARQPAVRRMFAGFARAGTALGRAGGIDDNYDGSWCGNDTVWRMCLDLQRVLHYARYDGSLAETMQRTVLSVTDGIIAGEGEGPLSPEPVALGLMTLGLSTAALDWVHALIMGLAPERLPLTKGAFARHRRPLAAFGPEEIAVTVDGSPVAAHDLFRTCGRRFRTPSGWRRMSMEPRPGVTAGGPS